MDGGHLHAVVAGGKRRVFSNPFVRVRGVRTGMCALAGNASPHAGQRVRQDPYPAWGRAAVPATGRCGSGGSGGFPLRRHLSCATGLQTASPRGYSIAPSRPLRSSRPLRRIAAALACARSSVPAGRHDPFLLDVQRRQPVALRFRLNVEARDLAAPVVYRRVELPSEPAK